MTTDTQRGASEQALRAWQDGWGMLFGGYGRQFAALSAGTRALSNDQQPLRSAAERIAASTRDLTTAQFDVAAEWLRLPLALTRPGNTSGLAASYGRLIEAYNQLMAAYLSAAAPLQTFAFRAAERSGQTAEAIVDAQAETVRKTAAATERVSRATIEATATAVEQVEDVVQRTAEQASNGVQAPADRRIKGNINTRGEKIYHLPGQSSYERTQAEEWFASEDAAQAAGYRRAETPGGGAIKGKITREGERIYHLPGQANYDRVEPDMLFETEEAARAAGFRASQR